MDLSDLWRKQLTARDGCLQSAIFLAACRQELSTHSFFFKRIVDKSLDWFCPQTIYFSQTSWTDFILCTGTSQRRYKKRATLSDGPGIAKHFFWLGILCSVHLLLKSRKSRKVTKCGSCRRVRLGRSWRCFSTITILFLLTASFGFLLNRFLSLVSCRMRNNDLSSLANSII